MAAVAGATAAVFQSLIGFKINWNNYDPEVNENFDMFQSLIGFKINWK